MKLYFSFFRKLEEEILYEAKQLIIDWNLQNVSHAKKGWKIKTNSFFQRQYFSSAFFVNGNLSFSILGHSDQLEEKMIDFVSLGQKFQRSKTFLLVFVICQYVCLHHVLQLRCISISVAETRYRVCTFCTTILMRRNIIFYSQTGLGVKRSQ